METEKKEGEGLGLPEPDRDYILEKAVEGFEPAEIRFLHRKEEDGALRKTTIQQFLNTAEAEREIEIRKNVKEKKANVSREELVSDLKDAKQGLKQEIEKLRNNNLNDISNDTMSNLIDNIKLLGEFIGELQEKDKVTGGTINVNKLEQNFNIVQAVQYLTPEKKRDLVEELENDPDIEDFAVVRRSDDGEGDKEGEEEDDADEEDVAEKQEVYNEGAKDD